MIRPALLRTGAAALLALALGGCALMGLGGGKPAQLYSFAAPPAAAQPAPARSVSVYRATSLFQREAAGDRILAITGDQASYIAESRWVAPAQVLFDQAVLQAFDTAPGRVRLVSRGEGGKTSATLRLDVRNFETRYDDGAGAAPTVLVRIRASLAKDQATGPATDQLFEARVAAGDNRVGAIVTAYQQALAKVLDEIVAWTNAQAR